MTTVSELVDKGDIPEERKDNVKKILHDLGYAASRAVGKAFLKITERHMTDAGMNVADANAILAEVELLQVAGHAPDGSAALSQELLARLDTLPEDTQAVSHLFKQGRLPVPYGNLEALEDMTKELVVGSSGKLAEFFSNKIRNGGLLDATGKNEEVTGSLMLSLIIETWTILQQFLPPERFLPFDYNKNKRVSATVGSIHDPTAGNYRPDMIIVTEGLLMLYGEEKRENMEDQALNDAIRKFRHGLSPLFYGGIPYLPFYTATGNLVRFHLLLANGSVADCQEVYNLQFEHHRAAFLLAVVHLQHLVQALLVRAPDRQMRAIQGVEDWQPTPTVNTCIIRHRNEVHKYLYLWNSFASLYGHSFEDVQAAYAVANQCSAMVSTAEARETPTLHGPVVKFRNDKDVVLQKEKYLKVILSRLGWSRHPSSLTVEDVCKVIRACLQSASALHAKQLVHRDFRYANVLWDIEGPFVIDLEMAATPPLKDPPMQLAWTPDTLDNGCFTFGSDVFQIGVMLSALRAELLTHKRQELPLDAIDFLQVLKSKVPAHEALQHAWLCN
ncbi:TPA: hypothetical protein ACH3X3_001087 [Trebouxia sp. C0006]